MPEPVVVFYRSNKCGHCKNVHAIWSKAQTAMKKVYPGIRFDEVVDDNFNGTFDVSKYPKGMQLFAGWAPKIILIPGKTWDAAITNLGPNNPIEIKEGVQVMNASFNTETNRFDPFNKLEYDWSKPDDF